MTSQDVGLMKHLFYGKKSRSLLISEWLVVISYLHLLADTQGLGVLRETVIYANKK